MLCCTLEGDKCLRVPPSKHPNRRYDFKVYYSLDGIHKFQKGKWSEYVPSWEEPVPVATEFGQFATRKVAVWDACSSTPQIVGSLECEVRITEYKLGHGCTMVSVSDGSSKNLYIRTNKASNLHLLTRSFKKASLCTSGGKV